MAERPKHRVRSPPDDDDVPVPRRIPSNSSYMKGGIVRIKLRNFLTFDEAEIRPSPGLNVILGPNGTGKSSIVCAICLGLAGSSTLLGRAKEMKYFVKHGKKDGSVEIDLYTGENSRPQTIKRSISAENNRSEWKLNGVSAKEQQITEVVKNLNIQLTNHCQFLPQDMVVKFAQMNPQELLEATEKAIGGIEMYDDHQKLKGFQSELTKMERDLGEDQTRHENLKKKNDMVSSDVERFKNRQAYLNEVKCLKIKKYWVEYTDARLAYGDRKSDRKQMDKELQKLKEQLRPYEKEKQRKEEAVAECRDLVNNLLRKKSTLTNKINEHRRKLKDLEDNVEQPKQELEEKKKEEEKRKKKIESLQREIDGFKRDLDNLVEEMSQSQAESQELNNARLREIQLSLTDLKTEAQQKLREIERIQFDCDDLERYLRRQRDQADSRLMLLQQKSGDTYNAIMWLRENQHRFRKPIVEPIVLVTNCRDREYLPQVESVIRGRDMFSFVAQCKEDLHLFMTEVHDKKKLKVNGVTAPDRPLDTFRPDISMDQLRSFGFKTMLLDHIDAPEPILKYLCGKYFIHNIPIAGELSANQIEQFERSLPHGLRSLRYFTNRNDFTVMRSRFADHMISRSREISKPEFLMHQANMSEVRRLEAEIKSKEDQITGKREELKGIMDQEKTLRQEDSEIRQRKSRIMTLRQRKRALTGNIEHRKTKVNQLSQNAVDIEAEEEKCKLAIRDVQKERVAAIAALTQLLGDYVNVCEGLALAVSRRTQAECERDILVKRCQESEEALKHIEGECKRLQDEENRLKDKAKQLLAVARRETGVSDPDMLTLDLKKKFDEYPSKCEDLDEQIHLFHAKAELCSGIDPKVVQEYNKREQEIDELGRKIEEKQTKLIQKEADMEGVKNRWLEALKQQVEEISDKFSHFFKEMGCAGQVKLQEHGSDFAHYGIDIMVKFRDTESLQLLTSHRQSGGERSVSTMLYLLALQDMTKCPFRAVDEINQGMDPVNERKVFNLIVDSVSGRSTAQYFLFTPKLLHGLSFGPHVTVHCIHNGPEMLDFRSFNIQKFLTAR